MNENKTPTSPSSTASSSLYRRHGLSPRQRRLLQAAARARSTANTSINSLSSSPTRQTDELSTSLPTSPSQITSTSLNASFSPIPSTPTSPSHNSHNSHNSHANAIEKHKSAGSELSTATTSATTVSIDGFRNLRLSPVNDVEEDAMRGKVGERVRRFNNSNSVGNIRDVKDVRGGVFKKLNEEDENDSSDHVKGPLNNPTMNQPRVQPTLKQKWKQDILKTAAKQMELRYYRVVYRGVVSLLDEIDTGQTAVENTANLSTAANAAKLDEETVNLKVAPARAVGKNEVATNVLQSESIQEKSNKGSSPRLSGVYVGYGEIVATSSPEITISLSSASACTAEDTSNSPTTKINNSQSVDSVSNSNPLQNEIRAIRVDSILTGGYMDDKQCSINSKECIHYGYLLLSDLNNNTIAESIQKPNNPSYEHGTFLYRVRATSPVRILSGPDITSPSMKYALLPNSVHNVSLRVTVPISSPDDDFGDDGDGGEVKFLKLGCKRGWVADRTIDKVDKRLRVTYLMQDVTEEQNVSCSSNYSGIQNVSMSQSLDCSSLNLSMNASSVGTPSTVKACRKRTKRRRREATLPIMLQESRFPGLSDSFDTASSATGYASGTVVSDATSGEHKYNGSIETFYLMRVIAPLGLKILDAPHFQVSDLMHTPTEQSRIRSHSPSGISPFARTNAMIGSSSADTSPASLGGKRGQRIRFLARGQFFEASQRMESTDAASLYTNGQGLIKLADGSGWVIIPHHQELVAQYENFRGGSVDPHEIVAYEELGDATVQKHLRPAIRLSSPDRSQMSKSMKQNDRHVTWLRIVSPNGVKVLLPPAEYVQRMNNKQSNLTPPKYPGTQGAIQTKPSSSSLDSEVASAVSSSFFDSVWSKVTPTKQKGTVTSNATTVFAANKHVKQQSSNSQSNNPPPPSVPVVACGTVVPVEYSDSATCEASTRCFVRLYNGQGWIPLRVLATTRAVEVETPEVRFGSFWFRVQSNNGIAVRHGPSAQAPIITSDCGQDFRFECGEFLRASEVITIFHKKSDAQDGSGTRIECFARLFRKNQSLVASSQNTMSRYSSIQSLTSPGEWAIVYNSEALFLEECSKPPSVERNREGWRCSAIKDVHVQFGPSYHADSTGIIIRADDEFLVTEKVAAHRDNVVWYRLKNDQGWAHSISESGEAVVHCHIADYSRKVVQQIMNRPLNGK